MKPVTFAIVQDEILSSEPTGKVVGNQKEYREVIKKQITLDPVELVDRSFSEVIFPGSVLRGDAFMEGKYIPVTIKSPKTITLSANFRGKEENAKEQVLPSLAAVKQGIESLIEPYSGDFIGYKAPTYITYFNNDVTTEKSFNKTFRTHVKPDALSNIVKTNFSYNTTNYSLSGKHYVLVKVRQQFFNISMDAKLPDEWGHLAT